MSNINNLTIAIVTYKRPTSLNKCLLSIKSQSDIKNISIIIIDNDPLKSAHQIVTKFKKTLKINYFNQPLKGAARCRNLAIKKCQTQYLSFIDDDCILDQNWLKIALANIENKSDLTFFQGNSLPQKQNSIVHVIQYLYQDWLKSKPNNIDTKNVIFNLKKIKSNKLFFDTDFPTFEDVDFGLQISQKKLTGKFIDNLLVFHQDPTSLIKVIKKRYYCGQIKYLLNSKWNNFDNYSPKINPQTILNTFKYSRKIGHNLKLRIYYLLCQTIFDLGFINAKKNKIVSPNTVYLVNIFDKGANQERTENLSNFLQKNGIRTELLDSEILFQKTYRKYCQNKTLNLPYTIYDLCYFLMGRFNLTALDPYLFYFRFVARGYSVKQFLIKKKAKTVILQFPEDYLAASKKYSTILDIPTIYSEEIKYLPSFPKILYKLIKNAENKAFLNSKHTAFHWYSFLDYAKKLNIKIPHSFTLNWGCNPTNSKAKYSSNPKIIHLGKLNSYWVNPPLLKKIISNNSTSIDIFSYEKPDPFFYSSLPNFKGYLNDLNKISQYQYGLITLSDDPLRQHGFSAKYLLYISYGLPVLCPEWKKDKLLAPATIYYNEKNFHQQLKKYLSPKLWYKKHQAAIKISQKLKWDNTLKPILTKIYS